MQGRRMFVGLMLALGVVACVDGELLKRAGRGLGQGYQDDGYGSDAYGYGEYDPDYQGGTCGGFDEEGVYQPCPCVTNIEDYEPCGFDEEGVYHSCPIACPEEGSYDEYPDSPTPVPLPPSDIPVDDTP